MPTNYLPQSTVQAWSWEQAMDPHLHHFQVEQEEESEREHMFEKPLTPSDVGKLNRLVIPKQHAEKHFPLAGASGEKGLLLSFEDEESGKQWRFRYSYWTSSQSYVLTKGWSRFVKEKRLDAGDVVLFRRRRRDHLLYIGSRRRGGELLPPDAAAGPSAVLPWSPAFYAAAAASPSASCLYVSSVQQECHLHAVSAARQTGSMGESSTGSTPGNPKRLRLFGVNLEYCGPEL